MDVAQGSSPLKVTTDGVGRSTTRNGRDVGLRGTRTLNKSTIQPVSRAALHECQLFRMSGRLLRGGLTLEELQVLQPDGGRNPANGPVLDALHSALVRVESELAGDLGRTTKGIDQCFIRMSAHGGIKRHV